MNPIALPSISGEVIESIKKTPFDFIEPIHNIFSKHTQFLGNSVGGKAYCLLRRIVSNSY